MAFWGIEVKASKPYIHRFDDEKGKLHLSQATLGTGSSSKKTILQCNVGDKRPVYLCSLLPAKFENCPLNLEFEGEDEVIFSVIGPYSIHLSGFFIGETQDYGRDDYESDSYGEDIAETESDESTDYDTEDEYDNDFIVEDLDMYPPSPVPNSGVVIEEILDDEKPADANGTAKRGKKKIRLTTSDDNANSERQLILKSGNGASILESEDEDGLPISLPRKNKADASSIKGKAEEKKDTRPDDESKKAAEDDHALVENLKRKVDSILQGGEQKRKAGKQLDSSLASTGVVPEADKKKNKKKKKSKEEKTTDAGTGSKSNVQSEAVMTDMEQDRPVGNERDEKDLDIDADSIAEEKKRKKKKKKTKKQRSNADTDESVPDKIVSTKDKDTQKETESKPFHVRSFPNGLVIEELAMGKPDGNKASPGTKVSVRYIGKLKKNGEIFDSNIGKAPFKFRLGVGQVIKGWDVGVNGMRVGDKRRLTIPPAMGYGATGAGRAIPPNAWLLFDVELVEVR